MRLSRLIYGFSVCESYTTYEGIGPVEALKAAADDTDAVVAIFDVASGSFMHDLASKSSHAKLMYKLIERGIKNPYDAARAYWLPGSKSLLVYQMVTNTGMLVDPPDSVIDVFLDKLSIRDEVEDIRIIG